MRKKIYLTFLLFFLPIFNIYAEQVKIPGAFGLKFGEKYNPDTMYKDGTFMPTEIGILLPVQPKTPMPEFFDDYRIMVTSKTLKIFGITASKKYKDKNICNEKLKKIETMFAKAYGQYSILDNNHSKELTLNDVEIKFNCLKERLRITYVNESMSKL